MAENPVTSLPTFFIKNKGQFSKSDILYSSLSTAFQIKKNELVFSGIHLHFNNTNPTTTIEGKLIQPVSVSFIKGNNSKNWKTNIECYQQIIFRDLYPHIDLIVTGLEREQIEFQWIIKPKGDPGTINIAVSGGSISMLKDQQIIYSKSTNQHIVISQLKAYQGAEEIKITSHIQNNSINYEVGNYNPAYALIIDPILSNIHASGFFGGSGDDDCQAIIEGRNGDIYVAGSTASTDISSPTSAYDTSYNGNSDGYVACFSEDLSTLKYFTFIGGSNSDFIYNLVQNKEGIVYVVGATLSSDFPTTAQCYDNKCGNSGTCDYDGSFYYNDAIIFALDESLSTLLYSTYLGGSKREYGYGISLSSNGNPIIMGWTESSNFPTSSGAYDASFNSGSYDSFVCLFDSTLSTLGSSTYLGGNGLDFGYFAYENTHGRIVAFSTTTSTNYPTTSNAYDKTQNGDYDIAVSVFNASLSSLKASTYIGGSGKEKMYGAITDSKSNAIVAGYSASIDYPVSTGVVGGNFSGVNDQVLTILDSSLSSLTSTYIGGSNDDRAYDVRIDQDGNPAVTGFSYSTDFPIQGNAYDSSYNAAEDAVVLHFHSLALDSMSSTYLGGGLDDEAQALLCHSNGSIYVVGNTSSTDYPTNNAFNTTSKGGTDVFITRFSSLLTYVENKKEKKNYCSFHEHSLIFQISIPTYIGYDIYTTDGKLIERKSIGFVVNGTYNEPLSTSYTNNIYIVCVRIGEQYETLKIKVYN